MTPYAVLSVYLDATDGEVRRAFHSLVKGHHPDSSGVEGTADQEWFRLSAAYSALKTQRTRDLWLRGQKLLSRLCPGCAGLGVQMARGEVVVCRACQGEGRSAKM